MVTSIPQSIAQHTSLFRQQLRVLFLKTVLSKDLRSHSDYKTNLVDLLERVSAELTKMAETAKDYPQPEALIELDPIQELIFKIATFDARLEDSNYLESEQVKLAVHSTIHAVYKLESQLRRRAFSNKRTSRPEHHLADAVDRKSKFSLIKSFFRW